MSATPPRPPVFRPPRLAKQRASLLSLLGDRSFQRREIVLSSGNKSNFYIDCKQTSLTAQGHFLIGQLFCAAIERHAPTALAVGGLTLGADPLASATATASFIGGRPLDAFLIRKEAKAHGTEQYLEGVSHLQSNTPVVILEDVVTTGASTILAIDRARAAKLDVVLALALVDRNEGGREAVQAHAPLLSLFTSHDFIDTHIRDTHIRDTHIRDTHIRDTHIRDTHIRDTHIVQGEV